ncbi:MAG: TetR family transcriptional regulator [Myxococcota bacterium]
MTSDSTRRKIQLTAEMLFAQEGFDRVTLRQIARAAGQGNVAAVQYHFGSKQGLLESIAETHRTQIDARRETLLAERAETEPSDQLAALLEVLIIPLTEKLDTASGRAYLRIQAEGLARTEMGPATRALTQRIGRQLEDDGEEAASHRSQPSNRSEAFPSEQRNRFLILLIFHALADRARLEENTEGASEDRKLFIESLNRAVSGILRA